MASSFDSIPQLDAMRLGTVYRFPVTIRGWEMMVRPLTLSETINVASTVTEQLSLAPKAMQNSLFENTILAKETLKLASTTDFGSNDPKITDMILERMTPDELNCAFKQYVLATDKCNPSLENMKTSDVELLVEALKKSPTKEEQELQLIELSFSQMMGIIRFFLTKDS